MTGRRHTAVVRVTHWLTALCFLALLVRCRDRHLPPSLLLGRNREHTHKSTVPDPDSGFEAIGADGLQLRSARPERLEPASAFPDRVGRGVDGSAVFRTWRPDTPFRKKPLPAKRRFRQQSGCPSAFS